MRPKAYRAAISAAVACCISLAQGVSAGHADAGRHRDSGGVYYRHPHRYHKYHRLYPEDYYFYRKIYYYPSRKHYYYYDFYPEKRRYYDSERQVVSANPEYLSITTVANMASQGVPDAVIIAEIERTRSVYKLNSEIITYLKQNNTSDRVIDTMLESAKKHD